MRKTRGILLSKNGRKIFNPDKTRLLSVCGIATRIFDRTCYKMVQEELWSGVGTYQRGFRKGACTMINVLELF